MTGLNLEPFLRLLRADVGVWLSLGAIALVVALMAWTTWGSRRALRKCLILSILVHLGLLFYGGRLNRAGFGRDEPGASEERIRSIRVVSEDGTPLDAEPGAAGRGIADWDRPPDLATLPGRADPGGEARAGRAPGADPRGPRSARRPDGRAADPRDGRASGPRR